MPFAETFVACVGLSVGFVGFWYWLLTSYEESLRRSQTPPPASPPRKRARTQLGPLTEVVTHTGDDSVPVVLTPPAMMTVIQNDPDDEFTGSEDDWHFDIV